MAARDRSGSSGPHASATSALYYAVSAALGGGPDRIGDMSRLNNFDTYVFRRDPHFARYSVMLGNVGRFAPAEAQFFAYYGAERVEETVSLGPRAHAEVTFARARRAAPDPGRDQITVPPRRVRRGLAGAGGRLGALRPPLHVFQVIPGPEPQDAVVLCYCTMLTVGELRRACAAGRLPLPGKENTGKLCTGCLEDFLYCQAQFETQSRETRTSSS
jgi:hypothetical protein